MNIQQLSALLLAISISVVSSVSAVDNKKPPVANKPHSDTVKKAEPKKRFKKSRGIRPVKKSKADKSIEKIGKFNRNGSIKSFESASKGLAEFINLKGKSATVIEKKELFGEIARFNWITGNKGFNTTAHYEQTVKLLEEASKHPALFGKVKAKFINRWLKEKEEQLKNPSKRVSEKVVKKVVKKEGQKKVSKPEKKQQRKSKQAEKKLKE
jgi:hypothetical protein